MSRLKSPPASEFGRKRRIKTNPPPTGKRRSIGSSAFQLKKVKPHTRVKEFPKEPIKVNSNKKLFCVACREELCLKLSSIRNHAQSSKHIQGVTKLKVREAREKDIAEALKIHNDETHLRGETLPDSQQVYRVKVAMCFLRAGVPFNKMVHFRELLENAVRLTDRRHMSDLIPFILGEEQARIKNEIANTAVSVIFDGTTRLGEALAIVLRYVHQRLVRLQLLAKSLNGKEIACELVSVLSTTYGIGSDRLLAAMRDGASTNGVAMRTLEVVYPKCMNIICFSHTIDRVGERFCTPVLEDFISSWIATAPKQNYAGRTKQEKLWDHTAQLGGGVDGKSSTNFLCSLEM